MIRLVALRQRFLRRDVSAHPTGQGGFALIAVIAAIGVATLLIGALFGLMFTTMQVRQAEERDAREARAADAAIETAINKLRAGTCDPLAAVVDGMDFTQDSVSTEDDVQVDVSCTSVASGSAATDQVRIVGGDGYQGALRNGWTKDCAVDATVTGCMPWAKVGSVPAGLSSSKTSLVHSGPRPLVFSSGVTVRTGAAALRTDTDGPPAIEVGGQYTQGSKGIGGTGATDCGILSGSPGSGAGQVDDIDTQPGCGDTTAAGAAAPQSNTGLTAPAVTPTVPQDCLSSAVVTFDPGTYTPAATNAVSRLTSGTGAGCTDKTFHFTPGIYSFQGNELRFSSAGSAYVFGAPSGWSAGPSSTGVQGVTGLLTDPDATLCDPTKSGATLVLAGWTRLTHTIGRVAICPNRPSGAGVGGTPLQPHPAILQRMVVPSAVTVSRFDSPSPPVTNTVGLNIPFGCRVGPGTYPGATDYPTGLVGPCWPQRTYQLNLATEAGTAPESGTAAVSSLRVMLTGTENVETPNNLITNRQTRFRLFPAASGELCRTDWVTGMPNAGMTSSFDLKSLPGMCSITPINQTQLNGARLFVDHRMDLGAATVVQAFTINKAAVDVNFATGTPATASSNDWNNVGNVTEVDNASASPKMPCGDFVCQFADPGRTRTPLTPFVHEMELEDFSFAGLLDPTDPTIDPALRNLRVVVKVQPSAQTLPASWTAAFGSFLSPQNFLTPGTMRLELRASNGAARCIVQGRGINSDQEIAFDLGADNRDNDDDDPASTCNTDLFYNASDLEGVSLTLSFELPCVRNWFHGVPGECLRSGPFYNPADTSPIWQIRPPNIESVRLTTVTDYYGLAGTSTATINAATSASAISTFNVFGRAWMPLADLDLNWNGPATDQPLFANDLVLHGLGSRMAAGAEMGNVCCNPAGSRTVELVARIDGQERLVARVEYIDVIEVDGAEVVSPGHTVNVVRWLSCGSEGCGATLQDSDGPPS